MSTVEFAVLCSLLKHLVKHNIKEENGNSNLSKGHDQRNFVGGAVHHKPKKAHNDLIQKGLERQSDVAFDLMHFGTSCY